MPHILPKILLKIKTYSCALLVLSPPLLYLTLLIISAQNAPCWDDFDALLAFANEFPANNITLQIKALLKFHNEHIILTTRIITLLILKLFGEIDFRILTYLGNLWLLITFCALSSLFLRDSQQKFTKQTLFLLAPLSWLIFQPQYYDTPLWPMLLNSNLALMALAALTLLAGSKRQIIYYLLAFFLGLLSLISQGNGILVLPILSLYFLITSRTRTAIISGFLSLIPIGFYLSLRPESQQLPSFLQLIEYNLTFFGAALSLGHLATAKIFGILIVFLTFLLWPRAIKTAPLLSCYLLFLLGSVALNSLARATNGAAFIFLQPRYMLLSIMIPAVLYLITTVLIEQKIKTAVTTVALIFSLPFALFNYINSGPRVLSVSERLKQSVVHWSLLGRDLYYPVQAHAAQILTRAIDLGIYRLPQELIEPSRVKALALNLKSGALVFHIDLFETTNNFYLIEGWAFDPEHKLAQVEILSETKLFNTKSVMRPDLVKHFRDPSLITSGFYAIIAKSELTLTQDINLVIGDKSITIPKSLLPAIPSD